ncbi:MAG TPA: ABC transporter substrate-binding protein [Anaerolineales bacterium]|nr:ABC transporter substrate-binding protein [Anaerolineales bacterium]
MRERVGVCLVSLSLLAASCTAPGSIARVGPSPTPSQTPPPSPTLGVGVTPTVQTLTVWVPPIFAGQSGAQDGSLLAGRVEQYEAAHPSVKVIVRVKDAQGPGGLLEALQAASRVAPAALPAAIALDPDSLRIAAQQQLILPLNGLVPDTSASDWFDYALQASQVDGVLYGIPFASEAIVLVYRTDRYESPPDSWNDLINARQITLFPAGDPSAILTLVQYLALGGGLADPSGLPALDAGVLSQVLAHYDSAQSAGVLPLSALQYISFEDTWEALAGGRAASATAPFSAYFKLLDTATLSALPLPGIAEAGFTMTRPWSWAVVGSDPIQDPQVADLLAWLSQPDFSGPWTLSLGLLPTTRSALAFWPSDSTSASASDLISSARAMPSSELLETYGPVLHQAVEAVLNQSENPESAAQHAAEQVSQP